MVSISIIIFFATVAGVILNWMDKNDSDKVIPPIKPDSTTALYEKDNSEKEPALYFNNEAFVNINSMLSRHLQQNNINYSVIDNGSLFRIKFGSDEDFPIEMAIKIHPRGAFLTFNALMYADVPDNKMNTVAELIARLNEGFVIGHFNLLYDSGHAEFEANIVLQDMQLTDGIIELYILHTYSAPAKYGSLFRKVIVNQDVEILLELIDFETKAKSDKEDK